MASSKKISASIILGGTITGALKAAFTSTKGALSDIGKAAEAASKRQRLLGNAIQEMGRKSNRDLTGLRAKYAEVTAQVDKLTAAHKRLATAEARHAKIGAVAGGLKTAGMYATGAGAAGLGAAMIGVNEAKKYETESARLHAIGLGDKVSAEAIKFSQNLRTFGTSQLDNLTLMRDALSVFGDVHHAEMAVPILAKMKFGNEAMYGAEQGHENETKFLDMLKVIELRGGTKSEADFNKQANMVQKVLTATGGRVGPEEWRHLIGTGGLAAKSMRDDAFFYQLEPLVQEMGGDRVGTGLSAAYSSLYQGRTTKRAANNLEKYGLIADPSKVKHDKVGQISQLDPGALKGAELFRQSQYEWLKQVLIPTLAEKGVTSRDQVLDVIGSLVSNRKGADLLAAMYLQQQQIDKNEHINRGADDIDALEAKGRNTAGGKELYTKARLEDAKLRFGVGILPLYTTLLEKAGDMLDRLNGFMDRNPKLAKGIVVGFTAVAASLAIIGPALLTIGSAMGAWAGYQLLMAKFGASAAASSQGIGLLTRAIGALSLVSAPMLLVIGAIAVAAFLVWKYWGPIKAWFQGLADGIMQRVGPALKSLGEMLAPLKPAWDLIASAVGAVWDWVTKLFEPFQATKEQLDAARSSGVTFGQAVGVALNGIIQAITFGLQMFVKLGTAIGTAIGWVSVEFPKAWETLKEKVGAVIDWIMGKLQPLLDGMKFVSDKAGQIGQTVGDSARGVGMTIGKAWDWMTGKQSSAPGAAAPNVPPMATAAAAAGSAGNTNTNHFNIYQQPGENSDELADRVARKIDQRNGVAARGQFADGAQH